MRFGPFKFPRLGKDSHRDDPYWDFFINTPPADLANTITEMIRKAPEGNFFPTKAELHTPEITSSHVKGMARYLGADLVGIASLASRNDVRDRRGDGLRPKISPAPEGTAPFPTGGLSPSLPQDEGSEHYPFGVICAVRADYDPRTSPGIGGQVPVQNGLFITFVLTAWIRELGFRATALPDPDAEKLAAAAGLGTLNSDGKLVTPRYGTRVHVANVIYTDLPLAPDS